MHTTYRRSRSPLPPSLPLSQTNGNAYPRVRITSHHHKRAECCQRADRGGLVWTLDRLGLAQRQRSQGTRGLLHSQRRWKDAGLPESERPWPPGPLERGGGGAGCVPQTQAEWFLRSSSSTGVSGAPSGARQRGSAHRSECRRTGRTQEPAGCGCGSGPGPPRGTASRVTGRARSAARLAHASEPLAEAPSSPAKAKAKATQAQRRAAAWPAPRPRGHTGVRGQARLRPRAAGGEASRAATGSRLQLT